MRSCCISGFVKQETPTHQSEVRDSCRKVELDLAIPFEPVHYSMHPLIACVKKPGRILELNGFVYLFLWFGGTTALSSAAFHCSGART